MVVSVLKKIIMFVPNKVIAINQSVEKAISLPDKVDKTFTYVTKVTGAITGSAGLGKGSVDLVEAIACNDGICAFI